MKKSTMIILGLACFIIGSLIILFFDDYFWQRILGYIFFNSSWMLIIYSDPDNRKKMGWKNRYKVHDEDCS